MNDAHEHDLDWNERLQDLLDDELSPQERAAIDAHLVSCPGCRATLQRLRELDTALVAATPRLSLDASFDARLLARIGTFDEARRAQARQRIEQESQRELETISGRWRRTLALIVPGIVAGIALAFAFAGYLEASGATQAIVGQGAASLGGVSGGVVHIVLTALIGTAIGGAVARWLASVAD